MRNLIYNKRGVKHPEDIIEKGLREKFSEGPVRAVIFDMDGVIFDSERLVWLEWCAISEKYGLENIWEVYRKCIGVTETRTRELFLEQYGQDCPYERYKEEVSINFHRKYDNGKLPLKEGVREILTYLKEKGYHVGLASSTREAVVRAEITDAGLLPFFDNLTCGDMLKKSKPEPDIYLMACRNLDVSPEEAVAVEDSYNGIRSAYRAGMRPVMIPDLLSPDEEMKAFSWQICNNMLELREAL